MGFFQRLRQSEYLEFLGEPWKPVPLWAMAGWLVAYSAFLLYAWREHGLNLFLDAVNMVTHEAGHPLFGYFGETLHLWGGTILQLFVPAALALAFVRMRQLPGTTFCSFLFFENFLGIATYMADARALDLPLVSAEGGDGDIGHDWNMIFSQLNLLPYDTRIAAVVRALGWLGMIAVPLWFAWRARQSQLSS
ncbi:MAG TPA: hypothetical protein VGQ94_07320 [Terriglobales bacterium]|jgi:hypothetical protein|nr:hypothetical protein [Terriglobales bacterium]